MFYAKEYLTLNNIFDRWFNFLKLEIITTKSGYDFNGYIDELRIIKGYAAYTGNFTPSNQPFPNP
jgi:hypothetical protein